MLRTPTLILPAHLEVLRGDDVWQSWVLSHPLSHPVHRHIFMEEGGFYFKIRKKFGDACFGPLSHPLFILPKGGRGDLVDKSREDTSPGISSHIAMGGVLGLKSGSRLSLLLLSWPICAQADGSCELPGSMVWSWQGGHKPDRPALGKPSQVSPLLVPSPPSVTQWGGQARLPWGLMTLILGEGVRRHMQ